MCMVVMGVMLCSSWNRDSRKGRKGRDACCRVLVKVLTPRCSREEETNVSNALRMGEDRVARMGLSRAKRSLVVRLVSGVSRYCERA
jgi:hypothetical protein